MKVSYAGSWEAPGKLEGAEIEGIPSGDGRT
jgi:hypothetical protein